MRLAFDDQARASTGRPSRLGRPVAGWWFGERGSMRDQPIPQVSQADVDRIVRRDFPAQAVTDVLSILDRYNAHAGPPNERVRLAVLKLAGGNLEALAKSIEDAQADYRDVLTAAEYPQYARKVTQPDRLPQDEIDRIIDADWMQYQAWLTR